MLPNNFFPVLFLALLVSIAPEAIADWFQTSQTGATIVFPLVGTRVSSAFGMRVHPVVHTRRQHSGLDLAAPSEAPVRAITQGTVVFADPYSGYGNLIVIKHKNGLTSHYGHLHDIQARIGTHVSAGEIIGTVGSTGLVTGPHLHFEIRKNGKPLDPLKLFPQIARHGQG